MTKGIRFQLLGSPHIFLDDKEQFFAFAKANALLYYLVVNGSVSREVAASLLWENKTRKQRKRIYETLSTRSIKSCKLM